MKFPTANVPSGTVLLQNLYHGGFFLIKHHVCVCVHYLRTVFLAQRGVQGFDLQPQVQVTCRLHVQVGKLHLWMGSIADRALML